MSISPRQRLPAARKPRLASLHSDGLSMPLNLIWTVSTDKNKLPRWRYLLREQLLPILRWETPYLAWFQANLRSPTLDSYFAISANLGTHTFFMIMLPILFWCGYTNLGRGYVLFTQLGRWAGGPALQEHLPPVPSRLSFFFFCTC